MVKGFQQLCVFHFRRPMWCNKEEGVGFESNGEWVEFDSTVKG